MTRPSRPAKGADRYDLIVIGSGPAGEKAAVKAAYFGKRVALVEQRKELGGAGANTGTLPSKALKESALFYSGRYNRGVFGAHRAKIDQASIDDFMFRKNAVVSASNEEVLLNLQRHAVDIYRGAGFFVDEHTIGVGAGGSGDTRIAGDHIIIATGSYPFHPPEIPFDGKRVHDSDTILQISRLPKSLCVVGAGVIGCEYATIFRAMGVDVHLVSHGDEILGFLDREIAGELLEQMKRDGIAVRLGASIAAVEAPDGAGGAVAVRLGDGETIEVDMFLFAAGRSGSTEALNCEAAGVETGKRQTVIVDQNYRTSKEHIYAVGDVIGFPALASTSMDQGRVAVSRMFGINDYDTLPKITPLGIYTIPEVSMVGLTEDQAREDGTEYFVGRAHHDRMARGLIMGARAGLMKILIRRGDSVILGVHLIGQQASELIHFGMTLVNDRKTIMDVTSTVFNYPTLHELYKYACYDALSNLAGRRLKDS